MEEPSEPSHSMLNIPLNPEVSPELSSSISEFRLLFVYFKKDFKSTYRRILPLVVEILIVVLITAFIIKISAYSEDRVGNSTLKFTVHDWSYSSACNFSTYSGTFDPEKYRYAYADCVKKTYVNTNISFNTVDKNTAYSADLKYAGQNFFGANPFQTTSNKFDSYVLSAYIANRLFTGFFSPVNWKLSNSIINPVVSGDSILLQVVQLFFVIMFVIVAAFATSLTMAEKENNIHAYMIAMGLPRYRYYTSHFITCTIKIWLYSIVAGIFIVKTSFIGLPMFLVLFLYSHFVVYSGLCFTTLATKSSYAVLFALAYHFTLICTYDIIGYSVFDPVTTTIAMIFHPLLAMQVAMENLFLNFYYYQPIRAFSEFGFYVPFGFAILVMVFHVVVAVLLTYYLDFVFPIDSTEKKHPLFFLGFNKKKSTVKEYSKNIHNADKHEPLPETMTPGIIIQDVTKKWDNGEIAVDHTSFVAPQGQITVLLGRNGSGKSTLFDCFTGLVTPTSGKIEIPKDETSTNEKRDSIGYCPRWDPLFPWLTVVEHLNFYGTIKTGSSIDASVIAKVVDDVGLKRFENVQSRNLSKQQKRTLSVGIALIGNSDIILLDEPSTDMIQLIKRNHLNQTILFTTQNMEEAEAVANWVVFLANRAAVCSGSVNFLTTAYDTGLSITLTLASTKNQALKDEQWIVNTVKSHYPSAIVQVQKTVGNQFLIILPNGNMQMFNQILLAFKNENACQSNNLNDEVKSLKQVFLKINEDTDLETGNASSYNTNETICLLNKKHGSLQNVSLQIGALFLRRLNYARRHCVLHGAPYMLLIALIVYALFKHPLSAITSEDGTIRRLIDVSLAHGPQMTIVLVDPPRQYIDHLNGVKAQLAHANVQFVQIDQSEALNASKKWYSNFPTFGFQLGITDANGQPHYHLLYRNTFPTAPIIVSQAITQYYLQGTGASITGDFYNTQSNSDILIFFTLALLSIIAILTIVFAIPIFLYTFEENGTRHVYHLAKLSTVVYWLSAYIVETCFAIIPCALLIVINLQLLVYKSSDVAIVIPTYVFYSLAHITQMFCAYLDGIILDLPVNYYQLLGYRMVGTPAKYIYNLADDVACAEQCVQYNGTGSYTGVRCTSFFYNGTLCMIIVMIRNLVLEPATCNYYLRNYNASWVNSTYDSMLPLIIGNVWFSDADECPDGFTSHYKDQYYCSTALLTYGSCPNYPPSVKSVYDNSTKTCVVFPRRKQCPTTLALYTFLEPSATMNNTYVCWNLIKITTLNTSVPMAVVAWEACQAACNWGTYTINVASDSLYTTNTLRTHFGIRAAYFVFGHYLPSNTTYANYKSLVFPNGVYSTYVNLTATPTKGQSVYVGPNTDSWSFGTMTQTMINTGLYTICWGTIAEYY